MDPTSPNSDFDVRRCFALVTERRSNGFVEFRLAIGDPDLFVEMILDADAFDRFCADNGVELLPELPDDPAAAESTASTLHDDWLWTLRDATRQRFR